MARPRALLNGQQLTPTFSFGSTTPILASRQPEAMPCHEQLSAPWDLDWESYRASVDVLQQEHILAAAPASTPHIKDMQLPNICTAPGNIGPASPDFKIRTPDRFVVDLAEYRRGYSYSVEMPEYCKAAALEQDCMTPRRVLDKENSDDFSSFAGLQEGPGTASLFSGYAGPASSPFAAHTRQPFGDGASCRSRLSDYGYDTASDEEGEEEEQQLQGMVCGQDPAPQLQQQPRSPPLDDRMGFWADVGAAGKPMTGCPDDSVSEQVKGGQWETNAWEYESVSDTTEEPDDDMDCADAIHPRKPGVLLPWDMD